MSANSRIFVLGDSFTIRLKMLSDWHIGTGTGIPGSIDALVARDGEGFPCVPAKTIVGIWRDALETLTLGLDGGAANEWSKWVEVIFGVQPNQIDKTELAQRVSHNERTYSHAIFSLQPARIAEPLLQAIKSRNDPRLLQALTFIKPEVKIDEATGTSETSMLRFAEMGRIGSVLEANCELHLEFFADVTLGQTEIISALLVASAKLVERIGGKRRRGAGKCELSITVKDEALASAVECLKSGDPSKRPTIRQETGNHDFAPASLDGDWTTLDYTLRLKTPISIVTATLGNVSETLDFIPGTYLLPHITTGTTLFKHVANGDLQVSPATIQVGGKRGLPVPKVLSAHKVGGGFDEEATVLNRFKDPTSESTPQLKPYREGYVSDLDAEKQLPLYARTKETLLMHNTVEDEFQRPTESVGGVYSRQAIAEGTTLSGEIRFRSSLAERLAHLVNSTSSIRLGTSKKDDYGLADIAIGKEEGGSNEQEVLGDSSLIVYLESDVLLRNLNLRQTNLVADFIEKLERELSVDLSEIDSLIQARRIESWHEGWGLPRPTLFAMQAGSCMKLEIRNFDGFDLAKKNETSARLRRLANSGIGERRGEGYGRIRFNPKILTKAINHWAPTKEVRSAIGGGQVRDSKPISLESPMIEFAEQIETTAWREGLQRAVLLVADDKDQRLQIFGFEQGGRPSMSQIGGLRSVIGRMREFADGKYVISWLTHLEQTENRLERWAQNKQKANEKLARIKDVITEEGKVWLILGEAKIKGLNVWLSPATLVRTNEELQKKLWAEAVRALFDACARAHKREGGAN
jgi:CRISPR-associated protein Csx10